MQLLKILAILPLTLFLSAQPLKVEIASESAILINADTGAILYQKEAHTPHFPASTTKIATALYALKQKRDFLDTKVVAEAEPIASISPEKKKKANYKLPAYWVETGSNHIGIKKGEVLSFRDLLYGMMLASANDASNVIAQFVSGSIPQFVEEMNEYLQALGCSRTHFCNPNGLHHPDHITTAYDLSLIAKEAMKDPIFREIVATVKYPRPKTNMQESTPMVQHNRLLKKGTYFYQPAIGIKTGYTTVAHHTFVGAAKDQGRTLIAVCMNAKESGDVFKDCIALFEAAFKQPKLERTLIAEGKQKYSLTLPSANKALETYTENKIAIQYYPAEEPILKAKLVWEKTDLPILKGERVGRIELHDDQGSLFQTLPLLAFESVEMEGKWTRWLLWGLLGSMILVLGVWLFVKKSSP